MLSRVAIAVLVAIFVGLGCILLGSVLGTLNVPIAAVVGGFLVTYGWALGVLAGLWHFFNGGFLR